MHDKKDYNVPAGPYGDDIEAVLVDAKLLHTRIQEMADRLSEKYKDAGDDLILVCVLKGAVFFYYRFLREPCPYPRKSNSWRSPPTETPRPLPVSCGF